MKLSDISDDATRYKLHKALEQKGCVNPAGPFVAVERNAAGYRLVCESCGAEATVTEAELKP